MEATPDDAGAEPAVCSAEVAQSGVDKVDVLLVVDNSPSMALAQKRLVAALPNLLNALATGNDDGKPSSPGRQTDFTPVQSLHIGVVTSQRLVDQRGSPAHHGASQRLRGPREQGTAPGVRARSV